MFIVHVYAHELATLNAIVRQSDLNASLAMYMCIYHSAREGVSSADFRSGSFLSEHFRSEPVFIPLGIPENKKDQRLSNALWYMYDVWCFDAVCIAPDNM